MSRSGTALAQDVMPSPVAALRPVPPRTMPPADPPARPISNARIAMAMFLVAETMFFAGLIGAYLVFRVGSPVWPPASLPHLPIGVTAANTVILLLSAVVFVSALRSLRSGAGAAFQRGLWGTAALGTAFVVIQGFEWASLVHHGLTLSSGTYGGTFYVLIGTHALHVVGAVVWLLTVAVAALGGRFTKENDTAVEICAIYWLYVCALWVVLFALVYR